MLKIIMFILNGILFSACIFGQQLETTIHIDTIAVIKAENIPTKEISFGIPYGNIYITKALLIETWDNELALIEEELEENTNPEECLIEEHKRSEEYLEFVKKHKQLAFPYFSIDYDIDIQEENTPKDTLYDVGFYIQEMVCKIIDLGEFQIIVNNKKVNKVVKADVRRTTKYYETYTTEYIVNDSIHFCKSIPRIRTDFVVDRDSRYVPLPPLE